jgi:hypothetical protein
MMQFTADFDDDLEKTQSLLILPTPVQKDEPTQRERAALIEIENLTRENLQQARQIAQLRNDQMTWTALHSKPFQAADLNFLTEARLFEVCAGLKHTLMKVLDECRTRRFVLSCGNTARNMLDDYCDELEEILSSPELAALDVDRNSSSIASATAIRR